MSGRDACLEILRSVLERVDRLPDPADRDLIYQHLVADLRSRRPQSVSPLTLGPPTEKIRDPRGQS